MRVVSLVLPAILAVIVAASAAAQQLIEGQHYDFKPSVYARNESIPPLGADKAKGLVIWNHGRSSAQAASATAPPLARLFNQRGWDVYSLYRAFGVDSRLATYETIQAALARARELGYRKIVLMGQSAGGYGSVEAVRYGSEVYGIVALAPAAHGSHSGASAGRDWRMNDYMMRDMWERFKGRDVRVAVAYFTGDVFYEEQVPNTRGPWVTQKLAALGIPHLVINQPDIASLNGHGAGQFWQFARRFGPCIFMLMETGSAPPCAEDDHRTLETFGIRLPAATEIDGAEPYAGRWFGTWSGGRLVAIPIFGRQGDRLPARYISGMGAAISELPENVDWPLQSVGNGLRRETSSTVFEFRLEGDRLVGTRYPKNDPNDKQTIIMRRAS